jgi:protoporphyrinogen oxidase
MSAPAGNGVVILGGGVAGLAAGYYLARAGQQVTVVERGAALGGLCGSFQSHGFTLDHGPHKLYSVVPGILDEIRRILGDALIEHKKKNRIRLLGRFMDYPLQLGNLLPLLGPARAARLGLGYAQAMAGGLVGNAEPASYEDYVLQRFGRGVYELVFEPLARKVWGDPKLLSADLAQARITSGGAGELILRLLKLKPETQDTDAPFFYYPKGGFGVWPEKLAEGVRAAGGNVMTQATPVAVEKTNGRVSAVTVETGGRALRLACDVLVSSIPIQGVARLLHPDDAEVEREAASLRLRDLILVFLVLRHDRLMDDHWVFFPEARYPFNRLSEQKAMSEQLGPRGQTAVCCDLTCDEGDPTWSTPDAQLAQSCHAALAEAGLTTPDTLVAGFARRFKSFYPMYTIGYQDRLKTAYARLRETTNLVLTGRLGMFNYNNSDHCLDMGRFIAGELGRGRPPGDVWSGLEERVRTYRIID